MSRLFNWWLYEKADYDLLNEISEIIQGSRPQKHLRRLFEPYLHPRGIKELAAPKEIRIVYAMLKLLDSTEPGEEAIEQRVSALKSLRDEVLDGNPSSLRCNTARVLLQIMKLLIRSGGNPRRRLRLAHELRMALLGQPRFIRRQLRRYHLLEMPEEWNQITFDDHVHDANTKGRKTPTHLIMDAWIKGIRRLQVIYYSHVSPAAANELLSAAAIMGVEVRIGVELTTVFRGRFLEMIWAPRGFSSADHFLAFLEKDEVKTFSICSSEASSWTRKKVLEQLSEFNLTGRLEMNRRFQIEMEKLSEEDFLKTVGSGQPSMLHLSEFIAAAYAGRLRHQFDKPEEAPRDLEEERHLRSELAELTPEYVNDQYLDNTATNTPPADLSTLPEMMVMTQAELSQRLYELSTGCRLSLNLSGCRLADVIEVIYDCRGRITHLEIFNLKDYKSGHAIDAEAINEFRLALNQHNIIRMKRIIRETIAGLEKTDSAENAAQAEKLRLIQRDLPALVEFYAQTPLEARLGSDSTGRYRKLHGMGMVVIDSLPTAMRRRILSGRDPSREIIPVSATVSCYSRIVPFISRIGWLNAGAGLCRRFGGPFGLGYIKTREWRIEDHAAQIGKPGNIATLGGYWDDPAHDGRTPFRSNHLTDLWNCVNSNLKMAIKVMAGFIPAFLTFYYTKDWWLLAYGGAFIWLGITGVRNIIQAVLGGGGLKRSDLLKWNDFISWQRIADSLLYTGLSVPLLDFVVKTMLLQKGLGLTAENNPVMVYSTMALVNGCYICSHNLFRGLPRSAATANVFRSVLSVPLAILFSVVFSGILTVAGVPGVGAIVQQWAAIISKLSSDCVAGIIEGYADRVKNINMRLRDYRVKLEQLFSTYSRLEVMFPDDDVLELLKSPKTLIKSIASEEQKLERMLIINAVDMLYFRMYQPQAANAMRIVMNDLTPDEREILIQSQNILKREKEISQLFVDGLVGKKFARPLSFYLDYHQDYLAAMARLKAVKFRD